MEKYVQTIGRRKSAIAQVRVSVGGSGKFLVNDREIKAYFPTETMRNTASSPLKELGKLDSVDVSVRVVGGGPIGQADAVRLGVARALVKLDETVRTTVKGLGFLTRDARIKERKKFGHRSARRKQQWRKR